MKRFAKRCGAHAIIICFTAMLLAAFIAPPVVTLQIAFELYVIAVAVILALYGATGLLMLAVRWLEEEVKS